MTSTIDFYQISLKLILRNSEGQILGLRGHPQGSYAGYYDLPGGRINEDELNSPYEELLKREISEELGDIQFTLQNKPVAIGRHNVPQSITQNSYGRDIHIFYIFFVAEYGSGDIKSSNEHNGFDWLDITDENLTQYFKSGILEGIRMYYSSN